MRRGDGGEGDAVMGDAETGRRGDAVIRTGYPHR
jgi:hypothetical protein